jgi:hypothetical protein
MGKLLPSYKKALYDEIVNNISSNGSHYYAFAANPVAYSNTAPEVSNDDYSTIFINDWQLLFGKKLSNSNIYPVISKNIWYSNTLYSRYDNTSNTLYIDNNYYVICEPSVSGGSYHVYKCIDNANGSLSTVNPSSIGTPTQQASFQTGDNYKWRYITSISNQIYTNFSTTEFAPVYPNTTIIASAFTYSGVEVIMISNTGSGYNSYTNGTIKSVVNSTVVEIESYSSGDNNFYTKNGIYIYNTIAATSQLFGVSSYISNTSGKWVYLDSPANTTNITASVTKYLITPKVVFDTDGTTPVAYSIINTYSNSIGSIVILDKGSNITRANVSIQSNTSYGSLANLYAIVPPAGGHGADPSTELNMKGMGVYFTFSNTENATIVTSNTLYNKIGILRNPYGLQSNGAKSGARYYANTFSQILNANVSPSFTFNVGETITGVNTGSIGTVVFSNSTQVYLTGDKSFTTGETLANAAGINVTNMTINTLGSIYTNDLKPLYVQNINNVNRSNTQTESFKLVIQV